MRLIPALFAAAAAFVLAQPGAVGVFEGQSDIGASVRPGEARFDSGAGVYSITGGGSNMWFASDAFHFLWKRVSGDLSVSAKLRFEGTGGEPHRKAGWVIRQGLEPDAAYVDVVVHGDGLTSMQFRPARGANTEEVRSPVSSPSEIRLERHGDAFEMWVAAEGEPLRRVGTTELKLTDPVYAGLAVCAHNAERMETAQFSAVKLEKLP